MSNLESKVKRMIKKYVILPDVHVDDNKNSKSYEAVKKFIKTYKPNGAILLGDFADVRALSAWDQDKRRLMEGRRFKNEMNHVNEELDYLQKYCEEVIYIEGNHENRITRYLDKNPEMEGLVELEEVLGLEERGIDFIPMNELYKLGKCYFTHGLYTNKYHAQKHVTTLGCSVVYGHSHNAQTHMVTMKMQDPHMAYGLGCLCSKEPDYMHGRPTSWINQFAVMDLDDKNGKFNITPINIIGKSFMYGGKSYEV